MVTPYTEDAFAYRVNFAARFICSGRQTTRSFDTCFEMFDGDAVAVALYRRARKNPKLRANLWKYIARASVVPAAFAARRRNTRDLARWAAEMRTKSRVAFQAIMDAQETEKRTKHARAVAAGYSMKPFGEYMFQIIRPDGSDGTTFHHETSFGHWACIDLDKAAPVEDARAGVIEAMGGMMAAPGCA